MESDISATVKERDNSVTSMEMSVMERDTNVIGVESDTSMRVMKCDITLMEFDTKATVMECALLSQ